MPSSIPGAQPDLLVAFMPVAQLRRLGGIIGIRSEERATLVTALVHTLRHGPDIERNRILQYLDHIEVGRDPRPQPKAGARYCHILVDHWLDMCLPEQPMPDVEIFVYGQDDGNGIPYRVALPDAVGEMPEELEERYCEISSLHDQLSLDPENETAKFLLWREERDAAELATRINSQRAEDNDRAIAAIEEAIADLVPRLRAIGFDRAVIAWVRECQIEDRSFTSDEAICYDVPHDEVSETIRRFLESRSETAHA
ncbi:MAG: hypothetical protein ACRD4Q_02465 [Candidatus Acidiferrales bacterium]